MRRIALFARIGSLDIPEVPGLGDMITRNVGMRLVLAQHPDATIHLIAGERLLKRHAELFREHSYVSGVLACPDLGSRSPRRWLRFLARARSMAFDVALIDMGHFDGALHAFLCGIPNRIGVVRSRRDARLVTHPVIVPGSGEEGPALLDVAAAFARALGNEGPVRFEDLVPCFPHRRTPLSPPEGGRPVVAVHAGGARNWNRRWPLAHFQELCERLCRAGASVYLLGNADERSENGRIIAHVRGRAADADIHDRSGASMNTTASCIAGATLFVGNDSSPVHVAGALGTPMVVIVGPGPTALWERTYLDATVITMDYPCRRPTPFFRERHHLRRHSCLEHRCAYRLEPEAPAYPRCLSDIAVERVWRVVSARLFGAGAHDRASGSGVLALRRAAVIGERGHSD